MKCNKMKDKKKGYWNFQWVFFVLLAAALFGSCKSSEDEDVIPAFDPSQPVEITDFIPKEGTVGQRLMIYGKNFGSDPSLVNVLIGGQKAAVVSVKGNYLYCFVPSGAYTGTIEVSVGTGDSTVVATAGQTFNYEKKMVVGTLCGYRNANDNQGVKSDCAFEDWCGMRNEGILAFDPLHKDHLYAVYDHGNINMFDLTKRWVTTPLTSSNFGNNRLRHIDFTLDGKYMLVAVDAGGNAGYVQSVWIVKRNDDGSFNESSQREIVASYMQTNGVAVHPVNGEMYFNSYQYGQFFRMDLNDYFDTKAANQTWIPTIEGHHYTELFTIQDSGWEYKIFIHPTGKYAYIVVINQNYVLRTDYNEAEKRFAPPYVVAGTARTSGWVDGVGTSVRFNNPYSGCFAKNQEYVDAGREDQYDFYIADRYNDCIRKLTPEGIVTTYAGRGSTTIAADNNVWGTEDGDLRTVARFRSPSGIAYDEAANTFYILDWNNRKMRTISKEK
jgi:hypothetical protein